MPGPRSDGGAAASSAEQSLRRWPSTGRDEQHRRRHGTCLGLEFLGGPQPLELGSVKLAADGIAQITVDGGAENTIVVIPGANGSLAALTEPELAAVRSADLVMLQLEIPLAGVVQAARTAHDAGVPVLLNPSPVQELPSEVMSALALLVVNEGEAAALGTALDDVPTVVTTLGASGARYAERAADVVEVPAPQVTAVDTTGAGDAFTGALAVAWLEGREPADALRYACAAGALATTVPGASSPTRAQITTLTAETHLSA